MRLRGTCVHQWINRPCIISRPVGLAPTLPRAAPQHCRHLLQRQTASGTRNCSSKAAQPNSPGSTAVAHGAVFSVQAVFALWYIVGHLVLSENDPLTFALAREVLSSVALVALAQWIEGDIRVKSKSDLIDVFVLGMLCYGTVMGFMFALSDVPEVQVAIAQPLVPALALGMSSLVGLETLSLVSGLGIATSMLGAVAFTWFNSSGGSSSMGHAFGYAALTAELFCYAAQIVYLPKVSNKYGPITLTAMYYLIATAATSATLVIRERDDLSQLWSHAGTFTDPIVAAALIFAVLGPTVFCFSAISYGSKKLKPSIQSSYITLQPILVALLSLVFFGKFLSSEECSSGLLVMVGLYLSIIGNPRMDQKWAEYMSDLPTNVPNTIAQVADAGASAASHMGDSIIEAQAGVRDRVEGVRDCVDELVGVTSSEHGDDLKG